MNATVTAVTDRVTRTAATRAADLTAEYRALVDSAARGEEVDPDRAAEVLDALDKTAADFAAAVARRERRLALRALLDAVPDLERRRDAINDEGARNYSEFQDAQEKYENTRHVVDWQRKEVEKKLAEAYGAAGELFRDCDDPELLARHRGLHGALVAAEAKVRAAGEELVQVRGVAANERYHPDARAAARARIPVAERKLSDARAEIVRIRTATAELEKEMQSA